MKSRGICQLCLLLPLSLISPWILLQAYELSCTKAVCTFSEGDQACGEYCRCYSNPEHPDDETKGVCSVAWDELEPAGLPESPTTAGAQLAPRTPTATGTQGAPQALNSAGPRGVAHAPAGSSAYAAHQQNYGSYYGQTGRGGNAGLLALQYGMTSVTQAVQNHLAMQPGIQAPPALAPLAPSVPTSTPDMPPSPPPRTTSLYSPSSQHPKPPPGSGSPSPAPKKPPPPPSRPERPPPPPPRQTSLQAPLKRPPPPPPRHTGKPAPLKRPPLPPPRPARLPTPSNRLSLPPKKPSRIPLGSRPFSKPGGFKLRLPRLRTWG